MSLVFALLASLGFGVGDFAATVGARRHSPLLVAFVAQGVGLLCALMVAPLFSLHLPTLVQCEWAAGAGLFGAAAFLVFLWALTNGPIGVVAPISAVVSVVVPIVVGLFGGERPTAAAWIGVTLAVSAIIMLSTGGTSGHATPRVVVGAIATGLGFGVFYVLFRKAGDGSGIWPVVIARLASVAVQFGLIRSRATIGVKAVAVDRLVWLTGMLDTLANVFVLYALTRGQLSIAPVIVSLYPASTVLLARVGLHEHLRRPQLVGLALAAGAIGLVAKG